MIDEQTLFLLRLVHGSYNSVMLILFLYQGYFGVRIRKNRNIGTPSPKVARKHRKIGPFLAVFGVCGFFAGVALVRLNHEHIGEHLLHFITGLIMIILIITTFIVSRHITSGENGYRNLHFRIGLLINSLYFIQAFFGLRILLA